MAELMEQYKAQIEALQKELERTKKQLKEATVLIQELHDLFASELDN
ncbi:MULTISPECIES: DUF5320 domain-containing protein [Flavobacterium]|nr:MULTISPECIES: DUF5320 domain-containing protein [Flavobacterium]MCH4828253.1 DUF5320 domain-containing protein [Flavobacterium columnare]MCH4828923.1 DUF5320 domain-containing protein [Flavobacterium columnare]MCH4829820.1 DUF5320 domain-containing protein [Flavobacterium columnare]MCH4831685.1 DUF5320 domain-containing protein [Flavobacterium columnare]MCH4832801.1 DUF5320 domain-containing protein [Flavobacterium columnare]